MSEAKPFASLSSGLLARKGAARPAMRPQGFGQAGAGLEDLGWNDMGFEPPKAAVLPRDESHDAFGEDVVQHPRSHPTGLTPVESPVHTQQAEIADRLHECEEDEGDETAELAEAEFETPATETVTPRPAKQHAITAPAAEPVYEESPPEAVVETPVIEPPMVAPVAIAPVPRRARQPRVAAGTKGKAAFTLRLDPQRHLKLRLACAVNGRSAQQLVTDALDQLLGGMPELESMAEKAKRKG